MRAGFLALALCWPVFVQAGTLAAARTLPAGTIITADDLRAVDSDRPGINNPSEAIGMQTRVTIHEGRPLHATLLQSPRLVSRNQILRVIFLRGALRIEAEGRALSDGAAGDTIRVMNLASRSTLSARVMPDGSVVAH
ncbi:flagellar basal body P-ring formation chaperone FlgA [Paracoccus bogoriensis]|uniref:flagellar basal body P-ring formation chaperone FlgA n=1 Tax=Paracoccus bogoriensis TaxID=242065 RepID=UPI001CA4E1C4|nr:flagellar basal body P-ring formation chaperone FlgA [Paracoccus bogoriensis]MBW7055899.1 flagellar basal body P-ring formation chaperone FlgA [Paracoccus bogoriensis]